MSPEPHPTPSQRPRANQGEFFGLTGFLRRKSRVLTRVLLVFAAVSLIGAGVMSTWRRARLIERRVWLRLGAADKAAPDDNGADTTAPDRLAALERVVRRRGEILRSFYRVQGVSLHPSGEPDVVELRVSADRSQPIAEEFIQALVSSGRLEFARVLPEGLRPFPGISWREVTLREEMFSLKRLTQIKTIYKKFRVVVPSAMTVRGPVRADYHTEGLWMEPVLDLHLSAADAGGLESVTTQLKGQVMALLIGGQIACVARIEQPIAGGRIQLRGMRDRRGVKRLAELIEAGPLPCPVQVLER